MPSEHDKKLMRCKPVYGLMQKKLTAEKISGHLGKLVEKYPIFNVLTSTLSNWFEMPPLSVTKFPFVFVEDQVFA